MLRGGISLSLSAIETYRIMEELSSVIIAKQRPLTKVGYVARAHARSLSISPLRMFSVGAPATKYFRRPLAESLM